jgi:hypothetical protein
MFALGKDVVGAGGPEVFGVDGNTSCREVPELAHATCNAYFSEPSRKGCHASGKALKRLLPACREYNLLYLCNVPNAGSLKTFRSESVTTTCT